MIEPATPAHAAALAFIHARAFPPGERWDAAAMATQLSLPGAFGWIADEGGLILVRVAADEAEILTFGVDPARRRTGLGRQLLSRALDTAARRGAICMLLEVAESNTPARALYSAFGFHPVGRRPRYYPDGGDALLLRLAISYVSAVA